MKIRRGGGGIMMGSTSMKKKKKKKKNLRVYALKSQTNTQNLGVGLSLDISRISDFF